jgi:hypothetical protein
MAKCQSAPMFEASLGCSKSNSMLPNSESAISQRRFAEILQVSFESRSRSRGVKSSECINWNVRVKIQHST